ncbi:Uncharacterised protein [Mycobacteroides abscessus subsp. abscessus]|nr:Uncharacterised protein [Mycobacteroides abscessus subsp. abscessus]
MVAAPEFTGAFDRLHILGFLDNADQRDITARIGTDAATLLIGDVPAHLAELNAVAHPRQCRGQSIDIGRLDTQQMECDALRALGPYPGQLAQLVNEVLDRALKHRAIPALRQDRRDHPPAGPAAGLPAPGSSTTDRQVRR